MDIDILMEFFDKIKKEIQDDLKLDRISLLDKQLTLPAIKHKWVSRLIEQKRSKNILQKKRKSLKEEVLKTLADNNIPMNIPKASLDKKVESSDIIKKIDQEIQDTDLIIDYLEKVESICRSMTFDIKNAVELEKLETT
jgi:Cu/Ag efflux protein CusF